MANTEMVQIFGDMLSSDSLEKISRVSGIDTKTASSVVSQALPELIKGINTETQSADGLTNFMGALDGKHNGQVFEADVEIDTNDGNKIVGHILGGDTTKVVSNLSSSLGISQDQIQNVLSGMAPLLLGALGKAKQEGKIDASSLSKILSKGGKVSSSMISSFLDKDGDGDIRDDLMSMGINYIKNSFFKK